MIDSVYVWGVQCSMPCKPFHVQPGLVLYLCLTMLQLLERIILPRIANSQQNAEFSSYSLR